MGEQTRRAAREEGAARAPAAKSSEQRAAGSGQRAAGSGQVRRATRAPAAPAISISAKTAAAAAHFRDAVLSPSHPPIHPSTHPPIHPSRHLSRPARFPVQRPGCLALPGPDLRGPGALGGWTGRIDGWMGQVGGRVGGWMGKWMDGWEGGWMGGWMGGWVDGWMDELMDGWMDGWLAGCPLLTPPRLQTLTRPIYQAGRTTPRAPWDASEAEAWPNDDASKAACAAPGLRPTKGSPCCITAASPGP